MVTSPPGFEPGRVEPSRFQVYRLNHSAKVTLTYNLLIIYLSSNSSNIIKAPNIIKASNIIKV